MTAALEGGECSAARLGRTLPPGKTRYPFYRRVGGPQGRSGRAENLVPTGIRSRTVQPIAQSLYRLSYRAHRRQRVKLVNNHHKFCSIWGIVKHGVLQGSLLGPLLILQYINDITRITSTKDDNNKSKLVLFPDDTSLIITSPNPINFIKDINGVFTGTNNWFNPLTPNDHYSGRTAPLTSTRCILYIHSANIGTEYFKHGVYSSFFPL